MFPNENPPNSTLIRADARQHRRIERYIKAHTKSAIARQNNLNGSRAVARRLKKLEKQST